MNSLAKNITTAIHKWVTDKLTAIRADIVAVLGIADSAVSKANAAQASANAAASAAASAQSTADSAVSAAASASSEAASAQSSADKAQSAADKAQSTADAAQSEAESVGSDTDALIQDMEQAVLFERKGYNSIPLLCGQPMILFGAGTPQESIVPTNWIQFNPETGEGYNWNGEPSAIGQQYIDVTATAGGRYIAIQTADYELIWKNF